MSGTKACGVPRVDARGLVDVEAESMACAVEESLHPSIPRSGFESFCLEVVQNFHVDVVSVHAVANPAKSNLLPLLNAAIRVLEPVGRLAAHDGSRDVAKESRSLRAGKNVHDDGGICANRAAAFVVGIHALISGRDDGVTRHEAE